MKKKELVTLDPIKYLKQIEKLRKRERERQTQRERERLKVNSETQSRLEPGTCPYICTYLLALIN